MFDVQTKSRENWTIGSSGGTIVHTQDNTVISLHHFNPS